MKRPTKKETPTAPETTNPEPSPDLITIEDMGPIPRAEFHARRGRITLAVGRNGAGKSLLLQSVRALGGAKDVRLPKADGATDGVVSGFGVTIKIAIDGSNRRKGQPCITSIDGTVDIGRIIEPAIEDPSAADLVRLKEIVTLYGLTVTPADVQKLLGGPAVWMKYCADIDAAGTVDFIARVKRALEKGARESETEAARISAEVQGTQAALAGLVDHGVTLDYAREKHVDAVRELSRLREGVQSAAAAGSRYEMAMKQISDAESKLASVDAAADAVRKADAERAAIVAERDRVRGLLQRLDVDLQMKESELSGKRDQLQQATQAASMVQTLRETIAAGPPAAIPDGVIAAAEKAEADAQQVVTDVFNWESRAVDRETVALRKTLADEAAQRAETIRNTIEKLPDLLADVVRKNVPGLKISRDMRIAITDHPQRGTCYFSELSAGERCKKAVEMAAGAAGRFDGDVLLALGQEQWEGLDYQARDSLAEAVAASGLRVVTAEAEHDPGKPCGPIRFEEYQIRSKAAE